MTNFKVCSKRDWAAPFYFCANNDDAPYRELIVHACTHNMAFDRQTESRHPVYYFDLISATKNPDYYRDRLLASLLAPMEDEYPYQMFAIAALLAASGDESARDAIYEDFARSDSADMGCADLLIRLDGYAGLQFVVAHRPKLDAEEDDWEMDKCIEILEERYGDADAWRELERMAAENSVIATWLEIVRQLREKSRVTRETLRKKSPNLTYSEVKQRISGAGPKVQFACCIGLKKRSVQDRDCRRRRISSCRPNSDLLIGYLQLFRA